MLTNDKAEKIMRRAARSLLSLPALLLAESIARGHRDVDDELPPLSLSLPPPLAPFHSKATDSGLGSFYFWAPQPVCRALDNVICSANCQRLLRDGI